MASWNHRHFSAIPQGMELNGSVKRSGRFFLAGLGALSGAAKTATTGYFMGMLAAFPVGKCHEEKNRFWSEAQSQRSAKKKPAESRRRAFPETA